MTSSTPASLDPLPLVLLVLTATTGLADAVSVLGLGRVFTANMTGNVVFLGFCGSWRSGVQRLALHMGTRYFLDRCRDRGRLAIAMIGHSYRRWLVTAATMECVLFLTAALLSLDYDPTRLAPTWRLGALLGLTACAMGVRNATARRLGVPDLTTTVLTLTLTGLGADSSIARGANPRWARRTLSVVAMLFGAAAGTWLVERCGVALPLMLTSLVVLGATLGYAWHPSSLRSVEGADAR